MISKKVLLIINTPAPCRIPLYNLLSKKIKNFKILFMDSGGWKNFDKDIKFNYEILKKSNLNRFIEKKLFGEKAQSHFNKLCFRKIREFNPDIIISGGGIVNTLNIAAYFYCLFFKKELVIWEAMSHKFSSNMTLFSKILRKIIYKKAKSFIAYSESTKDFLMEYGISSEKIYVGPNTIDIELFKGNKKEENTFLYIGRLSPEKNILFMLEGFKQKFKKKYKLILVGKGEQDKEIGEFIKKNKLKNNIFKEGFVDYNKIKNYYEKSDFLILPSTWEPWGLVVNEAIGSKTIPLISEVCGSSELILNGITGFKFNPYNINSFKKLLKKVIESNIDKNYIRKNLDLLSKKLTIENYSKSFEKAIKVI
jgi:glycosyltransferase involved in cell wall biosynthesis